MALRKATARNGNGGQEARGNAPTEHPPQKSVDVPPGDPHRSILGLHYDGRTLWVDHLTGEEAADLDPGQVDAHFDFCHGEFYLHGQKKRQNTDGYFVGVGPIGLSYLLAIMLRPGFPLKKVNFKELFPNTPSLLKPQRRTQRLKHLRVRAFGETGEEPDFLPGHSWNRHRTHRILMPRLDLDFPDHTDWRGRLDYCLESVGWSEMDDSNRP